MLVSFFFFFKQKTAYEMRISDWSSDVCSSDLPADPADRIGCMDRAVLAGPVRTPACRRAMRCLRHHAYAANALLPGMPVADDPLADAVGRRQALFLQRRPPRCGSGHGRIYALCPRRGCSSEKARCGKECVST